MTEEEQQSQQEAATSTPDPPKKTETPAEDDLLGILERDFIEQLKDQIDLEEFAGLDQRTRIKTFRALSKTLAKKQSKAKSPDPPAAVKPAAVDPTAPPAPAQKDTIRTNLERNNVRDYLRDVRQKNSVHNITSRIRGGQSGNINNQQ